MTEYFDRMNIGFVTILKYHTLSSGCLMLLFNYFTLSSYEICFYYLYSFHSKRLMSPPVTDAQSFFSFSNCSSESTAS